MVTIRGNKESLSVKQEIEKLRNAFTRVSENIIKNESLYGDSISDEINWFEPHSFEYRTQKGYLAPLFIFRGKKLNREAITGAIEKEGLQIFFVKTRKENNLLVIGISVAVR